MQIRRMTCFGAFAAMFFGFGATHVRAGVLYSQPTNFFGGYYSQNDTTNGGLGNYATVYDNFTLSSTSTILAVSWVGSYVASDPPMTGVTISIWADNSGVPDYLGSPLYTADIAGNADETFLEDDSFSNPTYSYAANIDFTASAGTQYWISIVPDVASPPPWVWESGTGGDGSSYQDFLGTLYPHQVDEAFALYDTPVPEPGTAALMAGGLALLALSLRRLKRQSA